MNGSLISPDSGAARVAGLLVVTFVLIVAAACSTPDSAATTPTTTATSPAATPALSATTPTTATVQALSPTPAPTTNPLAGVTGIVDPTNHGWPRDVEGLNGVITIPSRPARIINASLGHDEITLALVPSERLVAVGAATKDPTYSNVAALVTDTPVVSTDPELIISHNPDVVVTSPFFPSDSVEALTRAGVPVLQTQLSNSPSARVNDILLLGYIYGEEERAATLAAEVASYLAQLAVATERASAGAEPPRVLALTSYFESIWTAGANSTEGEIIAAAGAVNPAAEAGIEANATTGLEGVLFMAPDVIIIPQPPEHGGPAFRDSLLANEALAEVPAIRDGRVYLVEGRYFTTLSYWNVIGVEELARLLWPDAFPERIVTGFSPVEP